jgi:4-amino-4-deoxychorismate lyase
MWRTRYEGYAPPVEDRVLVTPDELLGDGVFETLHLRPSGPWLLDRHLDRLFRSAALLGISPPPRADIEERARTASSGMVGALRIILTRTSLHVTVSPVPPAVERERADGIRLITADIGYALGRRPPWSLSEIKSLSYGGNLAARRWAQGQGADDLLWLSSDGYALEAPTASLVWVTGDAVATVPADMTGILPGTTAAELLALAGPAGLRAEERMVTLDELAAADAIWLASSLRGLAEVTALNGVPRQRSPWTPVLLNLLGFQ